jgi:hypothetical protein
MLEQYSICNNVMVKAVTVVWINICTNSISLSGFRTVYKRLLIRTIAMRGKYIVIIVFDMTQGLHHAYLIYLSSDQCYF